jgi:3-hydroxy acid dehydrogenase/malonic semialdehyde reductase
MEQLAGKIVIVTGASSGIGQATAQAFAREGCRLAIAARRLDRLEAQVSELTDMGATEVCPCRLDVREPTQVSAAVVAIKERFGRIDILVNNAGLARGLRPVAEGDEGEWREMVETNVMGLLWMTRAVVPIMTAQRSGHIINIGSVAGHESYPGGSLYAGTKHAERAITVALRHELLGTGVRVSSVDPGLVETEFSLVRFDGDVDRAATTYHGMQPLTGADVAECIVFVTTRPDHVNIDQMIVKPTAQAGSMAVHREPS